MDSVLLPVGSPGGICFGLPEIPDGSGLVSDGGEVRYLDRETYRVWRACAAAPSPQQLAEWARDEGLEDAAGKVRELISANLLVADYPRRLHSLTARLIGEGLGNGDASTVTFRMRGQDGETVEVSPALFAVVMSSDGDTPLAELCAGLAERGESPGDDREAEIVAELPGVVRAGVVRLGMDGGG